MTCYSMEHKHAVSNRYCNLTILINLVHSLQRHFNKVGPDCFLLLCDLKNPRRFMQNAYLIVVMIPMNGISRRFHHQICHFQSCRRKSAKAVAKIAKYGSLETMFLVTMNITMNITNMSHDRRLFISKVHSHMTTKQS